MPLPVAVMEPPEIVTAPTVSELTSSESSPVPETVTAPALASVSEAWRRARTPFETVVPPA